MARLTKSQKSEITVKIIDASSSDWYEELVGKLLKVVLYKDDSRAESSSMPGKWIASEHFKIVRGKDPRTVKARTEI